MKAEKILTHMADVKALAEQLVGLTVKDVQELADFLKSEYGIEPAAAAVVACLVVAMVRQQLKKKQLLM